MLTTPLLKLTPSAAVTAAFGDELCGSRARDFLSKYTGLTCKFSGHCDFLAGSVQSLRKRFLTLHINIFHNFSFVLLPAWGWLLILLRLCSESLRLETCPLLCHMFQMMIMGRDGGEAMSGVWGRIPAAIGLAYRRSLHPDKLKQVLEAEKKLLLNNGTPYQHQAYAGRRSFSTTVSWPGGSDHVLRIMD